MILLKTCNTELEAFHLHNKLELEGVQSVILDTNSYVPPLSFNGIGVRVMIDESDQEKAMAVLKQIENQ